MNRILIFSIAYEPLLGGAELAVKNITSRLSRSSALGRDEPSYEFDLITCRFNQSHKRMERIGNVNVYRVGFGSRLGRYLYPIFAFRLAKNLHHKNPYQIVWSIMAAYAGAAALMFVRRFPEVKFLLTLQEGDPIEHIHRQVRGFRRQWQKLFEKADFIQAISQYLADWARKEGAKCPVEVVPNGVDINKFKNQKSKIKNTNQKLKIITVSRLVSKNGIDILIQAAAKLKTLLLNSKFLIRIVGSGPEEQKLKRLARDLKVDDCVEFLGDIVPDRIPEYLAQADIFVRPSRSEGLGSSFLEAMAAGLPVVGTAVGGIAEIIRNNENGLLVKPEDPKDLAQKIQLLLESQDLREKLGQNGRRLVEEKYSWDLISKKIAGIFSSLILK
jgi:glycosyltransferase involved in cell wall biosynthesis